MRYTRMHGAGNSFVILENLHGELSGEDLGVLALRICDPESGPGADGMIVVTPGEGDEDFTMLFYNADGSKGEMCGNGARCVARYGVEHGLVRDPEKIRFRATAGEITARRIDEENFEVRLNDPSVIDLHRLAQSDAGLMPCSYVELGDPGIPHAVIQLPEWDTWDTDRLRAHDLYLQHLGPLALRLDQQARHLHRDTVPQHRLALLIPLLFRLHETHVTQCGRVDRNTSHDDLLSKRGGGGPSTAPVTGDYAP